MEDVFSARYFILFCRLDTNFLNQAPAVNEYAPGSRFAGRDDRLLLMSKRRVLFQAGILAGAPFSDARNL